MIKFASTTFAILVGIWIKIGFMQPHTREDAVGITLIFSIAWLAVFGTYFAWLILLAMIRQVGAAVRSK